LAVTKFHFCCVALTCQTYFLQFLNFMSGGALVSQTRRAGHQQTSLVP
jgi:hypothetical protein